jgi:hypothetical protein
MTSRMLLDDLKPTPRKNLQFTSTLSPQRKKTMNPEDDELFPSTHYKTKQKFHRADDYR